MRTYTTLRIANIQIKNSEFPYSRQMSTWNRMRNDRIQVALESILLKRFAKPEAVLERRIIQTPEFRKNVLTLWAQHCLKNNLRYTTSTISELVRLNVCTWLDSSRTLQVPKDINEESRWLLEKLHQSAEDIEVSAQFPKELAMTGMGYSSECFNSLL